MTLPDGEQLTALVEKTVAELSDDEFGALVERTRAPQPEKGTHVPGVGNQPPQPHSALDVVEAQIRAAQEAGDTSQVKALRQQGIALKTAQMMQQHRQQNHH